MKNIKFILLFTLATSFLACEKADTFDNTETKVGESRVTFFPVFQMTGDPIISIVKGTAYVEPGIKATEGGKEIAVTTTGTVNVNTPGLYVLNYSATNKDGFSVAASRTVVVLAASEVAGTNIAGKYSYVASPSTEATYTKVAEGVYTASNIWSHLTTIPIILVTLDGVNITIPNQNIGGFGTINSTGVMAAGIITYKHNLPEQGIANNTRVWKKL